MREWAAGGLMTVGALIALASAIRMTAAYRRYVRSRKAEPGDRRERAIAGLELAYSGALNVVNLRGRSDLNLTRGGHVLSTAARAGDDPNSRVGVRVNLPGPGADGGLTELLVVQELEYWVV